MYRYLMFICHLSWKPLLFTKDDVLLQENLAVELNTPLPSSAACERMFSSGGLILRFQTTCMSDKHLDK